MNKAILKENWGKYTDTDKLVDDIMALLTNSRWRNSEHGVCTVLNEFFTQKEPLIKMLQKSEHYTKDMRIVVEKEFARDVDNFAVRKAIKDLYDALHVDKILIKYVDDDGKSIYDYLKRGVTKIGLEQLDDEKFIKSLAVEKDKLDKFNSACETKESREVSDNCRYTFSQFEYTDTHTLSKYNVENILEYTKNAKVTEGMKTSRAFNHICELYKVNDIYCGCWVKVKAKAKFCDGTDVPEAVIEVEWNVKEINGDEVKLTGVNKPINKKYLSNATYNKLFAKYADLVSNNTRTLQFVISVNPYDYFTMSVGNSWTSCQNITAHGGWSGGVLSYLMDPVSIMTYCVGKKDDVQKAAKIYRNLFHYTGGQLMQNRIYPQGNDGKNDLYERFRDIVHEEIANMLDVENKWSNPEATPSMSRSRLNSTGSHYTDYYHNRSCNITTLVNNTTENSMTVGHESICVYCGRTVTSQGILSHHNCSIEEEA